MIITRQTSFTQSDITALDNLMHTLSPTSWCDGSRLAAVIADENSRVFVAVEDERIIGTATLCVVHTPEFTLGFIEAVVVLPEYRGKHIAFDMMQAVLQDARSLGVEHLHLTSNPSRVAANRLYQKLGFLQKETNVYELHLLGKAEI